MGRRRGRSASGDAGRRPDGGRARGARARRGGCRTGRAAAPAAAGGLPGWFWTVTALVEIAVIVTAAAMLVHYAV